MKIAFRADASATIGLGHLARCLTLAEEFRRRGADACFIARDDPSLAARLAARRGFPLRLLPPEAADPANDAAQTIDLLRSHEGPVDWMVTDHYGLDAQWEARVRDAAARMLAIDDLANRSRDCDVLLDQNFRLRPEQAYGGLVPEGARLLLGPRYALVAPEYARARSRVRDGSVRRVLVAYGGADPGNETTKAMAALDALGRTHLQVDVAVSSANPNLADLRRAAARAANVVLHEDLPHLARLVEAADLALGAGGTSTWERLCAGLPSLVTAIADNQAPAASALAQAGYLTYLGPARSVTVELLARTVASRLAGAEALRLESIRARSLVDGAGASRVADEVMSFQGARTRLRPAGAEDEALLLAWANDPEVRRWSFHPHPIEPSGHREWLRQRLADPAARIWILEHERLPKGQVRCERIADAVQVDYSVAAEWRGRGLACAMLIMGARLCGALWPGIPLKAEVMEGNLASVRALRAAGFGEQAAPASGRRIFVRVPRTGEDA